MDNRNTQNVNQETEIDLLQLLNALKDKILLIIPIVIACALVGFILAAAVIKPTYTASAKIYVNNMKASGDQITTSDLSLQKSLVSTYLEFIKTYEVMEKVKEKSGVDYSVGQLIGMVSANQVGSTEIFQIKITCGDPKDAANITNAIADVLPERIAELIPNAKTSTVEAARVPSSKSGPSITKYTAIGGILGLVAICGIIIIKELIDDRIHGSKDLVDNYSVPVLTSVPDLMIK